MVISSLENKKLIPYHLAIIMDGNRRWAKNRGLPLIYGHHQGLKTAERVGKWCKERGVKVLTLWAFSTENWRRSKTEINYLMKLLLQALNPLGRYIKELHKENIKVQVVGQKERLPKELQKLIQETEELTKDNKEGILNLAISYGGRTEILEAVKRIIKKKIPPAKINEKVFAENLWTGQFLPPDLIIRTSGEQRLSGFLPWQAAYSELYFSQKLWPDFTEKDLEEAFNDYRHRQRRFGN